MIIGWRWHSQRWDEDYDGYLQKSVQQWVGTKTRRTALSDMTLRIAVNSDWIPDNHEIQK